MSFDANEFAKLRVDFNDDPQNSLGIETSQIVAIQSKIVEIDGTNDSAKKSQLYTELKKLIDDEQSKFTDLVSKVDSNIKSSYSNFILDTPLKLLIRKNSNISPDVLGASIKKLYETKLNNEKSSLISTYCGEQSAFPEWLSWGLVIFVVIFVLIILYLFVTKRYNFTVARKE